MKIFIADKFEAFGVDALKHDHFDVVFDPGKKGPELAAAVGASGAKVLVVRSTKVTAEIMDAARELALIVRAGAGVDNIDMPAASTRSILVANCPGMNAVAVAELTMALVLSLDRRVPDSVAELRAGKWNKAEYSKARGLKGRTLGLLGLGPIGKAVARRAAAFEMHVIGWSRSLAHHGASAPGVHLCSTPHEVVSKADIVSVHLASSAETRGFVGRKLFEAMKPGTYFINTSRGDVVDADALSWAVQEQDIRAGLDVYASEPAAASAEFKDPLFQLPGVVYGTPHIAASTDQAQTAIAHETVRIIKVFRSTGRVENCVNLCPKSSGRRMLLVRHRNQPGVLAHVLSNLSFGRINVEEMENVILADRKTAVARISLDASPGAELIEKIRTGSEHILAVAEVERPEHHG